MTDKWDKLKEELIDIIKTSDDSPTEEQIRFYDIKVGELMAEGDSMQAYMDSCGEQLAQVNLIMLDYEKRLDAINALIIKDNKEWSQDTGKRYAQLIHYVADIETVMEDYDK